jgi:hypothetical protein
MDDNDLHDLHNQIAKRNAAINKATLALCIIVEKNNSLNDPIVVITEQAQNALDALTI